MGKTNLFYQKLNNSYEGTEWCGDWEGALNIVLCSIL